MDYMTSAEGIVIDRARALYEIRKHQASEEEFLKEMGDHAEYEATAVLGWLGY